MPAVGTEVKVGDFVVVDNGGVSIAGVIGLEVDECVNDGVFDGVCDALAANGLLSVSDGQISGDVLGCSGGTSSGTGN